MKPIKYIDRQSKKEKYEEVFGGKALKFLYETVLGKPVMHLISKTPFISWIYGAWQKLPFTKHKILSFVKRFELDEEEFVKPISDFASFNDFFVRHLTKQARPLKGDLVCPADARYKVFPNIKDSDGFYVKGKKFSLESLLKDGELAKKYEQGTLIIGRLCPTDCHRFFFPCNGTPSATKLINGHLYSVNPIALKQNINIFTENKRTLTEIKTERYGTVLYLEVGATNVGSIKQTFNPNAFVKKGDEKGYFSFGASVVILIFEPKTIILDHDLIEASKQDLEIRCLYGMNLGSANQNKSINKEDKKNL